MAGRGGLDGVLRYAVSGVAGGIGLASESIHARKERKKAKSSATANSSSSTPVSPQEEGPGEEIIIEQEDEKQWDLDDAQTGLPGGASSDDEPPEYTVDESSAEKKPKPDGRNTTEAFLKRYPPPTHTDNAQPLPLPVILPQRRPKDRTRGFIRAYAPELEIRGINQAMFLDFLQTFEKASEANPWINAINLAGIATTFIPDGFGVGLAVGIALQMSVKVAMDLQSRTRTNAFLDKMNDEFYRPRGLYCLVMTWSPESSEISSTFDLTSTISAKSKSNSSGPSKFAKKFSNSSGKTYADMGFPEVAPLIFPALDNLAEQQGEDAVRKRDKLKKKANFVDDYWDKRAQAKYNGKHPDSVLSQTPKPTFTSRYADPNHPASSGSLISLVTGGHINPPTMQQGLKGGLGGLLGGGRAGINGNQAYGGRPGGLGGGLGVLLNQGGGGSYDRGGRGMSGRMRSEDRIEVQGGAGVDGQGYLQGYTQGQRDAGMYGGRGMNSQGSFGGSRGGMGMGGGLGLGSGPLGLPVPTPQMAIKKLLKKDVLYLMIVNMPSEAEMVAAMAATEGQGR